MLSNQSARFGQGKLTSHTNPEDERVPREIADQLWDLLAELKAACKEIASLPEHNTDERKDS